MAESCDLPSARIARSADICSPTSIRQNVACEHVVQKQENSTVGFLKVGN